MAEPTPPPQPIKERRAPVERAVDAHARIGREILERNAQTIDAVKIAPIPDDLKTDDFFHNIFRFHSRHKLLDERMMPGSEEGRDSRAAVHALISAVPFTMSERARINAQDYDQKFEFRNGERIHMKIFNDPAFRREAELYAEQIAEDPTHYQGGILMLDVNDFKLYNNLHTETVGDDALRNVAEGLNNSLRTTPSEDKQQNGNNGHEQGQDGVGRIAGDEFTGLIRNYSITTEDDPSLKASAPTDLLGHPAERVRVEISDTHRFPAPDVKVTVGYSDILPGEKAQMALDRASDAKKVGNLLPGKNRTIIARPDLGEDVYVDVTNGGATRYEVLRHPPEKQGERGKFATLKDITNSIQYPIIQLGGDKMKRDEDNATPFTKDAQNV